jgi:hypothetical protein
VWTAERIGAPQAVDPGEYEIVARIDGRAAATATARMREGAREIVRLVVPSSSADPAEGEAPVLAYVGFTVAGTGVVVGTVTGVLSLVRAGEVEDACFSEEVCPRSVEPLRDESVALAHVATTSFVLAGAGVVLGVIGLSF